MSNSGTRPDKADIHVADALPGHWAERWLPVSWRPYARLMRLERPVGWWLLLLPGLWAIVLAAAASSAPWREPLRLAVLFFIGAVAMRGAGCVYNDIVDRDIDARVARTRSRPIPSGQVSLRAAVAFMLALLFVGLLVLLQLPPAARLVAVASLALVAIYPFMKRVTFWPQLFLGLAFNWGALVGWVALRGRLEAPALLLYAGGVFWTLAYDTIYAHQDRQDDILAGVKSTALKLGSRTRPWLAVFFALALALFTVAGYFAGAGFFWYLGLGLAALHAFWQLRTFDMDDAARCLLLFRSNEVFGRIILAGALLDYLVRIL